MDFLGLLPLGPKLSCSTEAVMTSRYQFSLSVPDGGVVHIAMSTSAMTGEAVWVVASIKSSLLTGGDSTWLNSMVWGCWFVAPWWTTLRPQRISQLVDVTCSHIVSLSSTTLPTKGQKSGLSSGLSSSAKYCSPLALGTIRRIGCCLTSWYDNSSGRKAFLLRHLGAGGALYSCSRRALILTLGIEKEAKILQVSFHSEFSH